MNTAKILAEIGKHMVRVGKERDSLDDFISDLGGLKDDCSEAYDALQDACDALSKLV
jgi:hypothetical protein